MHGGSIQYKITDRAEKIIPAMIWLAGVCSLALALSGCKTTMYECPVLLDTKNANNKMRLIANLQDRSYSAVLSCGQSNPVLVGKFPSCLDATRDKATLDMYFGFCVGDAVVTPSPIANVPGWNDLGDFQVTNTVSPVSTVRATPTVRAAPAGIPVVTARAAVAQATQPPPPVAPVRPANLPRRVSQTTISPPCITVVSVHTEAATLPPATLAAEPLPVTEAPTAAPTAAPEVVTAAAVVSMSIAAPTFAPRAMRRPITN